MSKKTDAETHGDERMSNDWFIKSMFCLLIISAFLLFVLGIFSMVSDQKTMWCLKPIAEEICDEKEANYISNNKEKFTCSTQDREDLKLNFHPEEIEKCTPFKQKGKGQ